MRAGCDVSQLLQRLHVFLSDQDLNWFMAVLCSDHVDGAENWRKFLVPVRPCDVLVTVIILETFSLLLLDECCASVQGLCGEFTLGVFLSGFMMISVSGCFHPLSQVVQPFSACLNEALITAC